MVANTLISAYPIQIGRFRTKISTEKELQRYVNLNNGVEDIFYSLYPTTTIDKILFDLDDDTSLQEVKRFEEYLYNLGVKHLTLFSGRGFHIVVFAQPYIPSNPHLTVRNAQLYYIKTLSLKADYNGLGDTSKMDRLPQTLNTKSNLYSITLTHIQTQSLTYEQIRKLALKPQPKEHIEGTELIQLQQYDSKEISHYDNVVSQTDIDEIGAIRKLTDVEFQLILKALPPCMKEWVLNYTPGSSYSQRYDIINHLKHIGIPITTTVCFFYTFLDEEKFHVIMAREHQITYLYSKTYRPSSCDRLALNFTCHSCSGYPCPSYRYKEILQQGNISQEWKFGE